MKTTLFLALWLLAGLSSPRLPEADAADDSFALVKDAIIRSICHEVYWDEQRYRLGAVLPLEIKMEGARFYAWVEHLEVSKRNRMSFFYEGRIKEGKGAVISRTGYNMNITDWTPASRFFEYRSHFDKDAVKTTLETPRDCAPRYDPPTPQKERMVETVVSTMRIQMSDYVRRGFVKYPKEITIVIADFNVDYPWTYVLVEGPGKLYYWVILHSGRDYDSDQWEREGEYPFTSIEIEPVDKSRLAKIRRHGIRRKIVLDP